MVGFHDSSFLTGANATFIAELYARYLEDPASVDASWLPYFAELADDAASVHGDFVATPWAKRGTQVIGVPDPDAPPPKTPGKGVKAGAAELAGVGASEDEIRKRIVDSIRALMMIRVYRVRGHLMADLDPLKMAKPPQHPELDFRSYGFTEDDLDREIYMDYVLGLEKASLRRIIQVVQQTYCGTIGVEYMHIQDPDQKAWIQKRMEAEANLIRFTDRGKRAILERLTEAEGFERFLQLKYTGTKRFGLEGGETTIPAIEQILKRGSQLGIREVVLGMAHRGRLNMLTTLLHKPYRAMFSEFQGNPANPEDVQGSGDVKYHLGTSADREFDGISVHLSLTANPSHLDAVDPVVLGKVRAKQEQRGDVDRKEVMGLLIHGDAALAGQGVIAECLMLSQLRGYTTGGTLHLVINNQIGFTTAPRFSRSGPYCTDVAKAVQAPIFHVNGDDPEAVVHVSRIAVEFRQEFKTDVVVDMVCYRRHGHNESDEPAFTQPIMYRKIARHPTTRQVYARVLTDAGVIAAGEADSMVSAFHDRLETEFAAAKSFRPNKADWLEGRWAGLTQGQDEDSDTPDENASFSEEPTGVELDALRVVGHAISSVPEGININRKILRQLDAKRQMMESGQGVDWATAEALAFGTLLAEGTPVRLSGQDCGRGTFSQRHAVLIDQDSEERYVPLAHVGPDQGRFEILDSPLSENAVLGYEYGYSLAEPHQLVLWEGQFGDFANGAQVIIDQFVSSAESKWLRMSGLVMLLPHGYEGQGPEHSSARLERYLQLCAEDNVQIGNFTSPANYFHALRRQVRRNFRKPLILMTPKSMLRDKRMVSAVSEFMPETRFLRTIGEVDTLAADDKVRRVLLCSGKVYFDLVAGRAERGIDDVAVVRVEQLYPWPKNTLFRHLSRYPNAEIFWVQEEPANMGAWLFAQPRLSFLMEELGRTDTRPTYIGRRAAASPATGLLRNHTAEQAAIVEQALLGQREDLFQPFRRSTKLARLLPQGSVPKKG
ncbi:MAG: 2-oxoglutarate dehydrogenase E1 component [Rhodospirillaceae bacterium]|nr:2-oxoglutarate dehydrogenase E1 component [Rhodospirillaceae bacterium]